MSSHHGDLDHYNEDIGLNKQLHCYDPPSHTWTTVKSLGAVPSPHTDHSVAYVQ